MAALRNPRHRQRGKQINADSRIGGGAFAVARGRAEPWGLADLSPAELIGAPNSSLADLPAAPDASPRRRSADR